MSQQVGSTKMFVGLYQFRPVPLFDVSTELIRDDANNPLSLRHTYDFQGTLLERLPSQSGTFPDMYLQKELLKRALTESGVQEFRITFENKVVQSGIFPTVTDVSFEAGVWVDRINYTFSFTHDQAISGQAAINAFSDEWTFDENDDRRTINVNHSISAVGVNTSILPVSNALDNARDFVLPRTGYSNVPAGYPVFVEGSGSLSAFQEKRSENINAQNGTFSVTESFILSSGNFVHTQTGQINTDSNGISTVSLDGNIKGLGRKDAAWFHALSALNTYVKPLFPSDASGIYIELGGDATLFTFAPESESFTKNKYTGTIDYSISFTDDPSQNLPSGIQDFTITVQDDKPVRLFASFAIMERSLGNVVQDIGTSTEGTYSVAGNAIGVSSFPFASLISYCEDRINDLKPMSINYVNLRLEQRSITKDEDHNTLSFNIVWKYTKGLGGIPSATDDIVLD